MIYSQPGRAINRASKRFIATLLALIGYTVNYLWFAQAAFMASAICICDIYIIIQDVIIQDAENCASRSIYSLKNESLHEVAVTAFVLET